MATKKKKVVKSETFGEQVERAMSDTLDTVYMDFNKLHDKTNKRIDELDGKVESYDDHHNSMHRDTAKETDEIVNNSVSVQLSYLSAHRFWLVLLSAGWLVTTGLAIWALSK